MTIREMLNIIDKMANCNHPMVDEAIAKLVTALELCGVDIDNEYKIYELVNKYN